MQNTTVGGELAGSLLPVTLRWFPRGRDNVGLFDCAAAWGAQAHLTKQRYSRGAGLRGCSSVQDWGRRLVVVVRFSPLSQRWFLALRSPLALYPQKNQRCYQGTRRNHNIPKGTGGAPYDEARQSTGEVHRPNKTTTKRRKRGVVVVQAPTLIRRPQ